MSTNTTVNDRYLIYSMLFGLGFVGVTTSLLISSFINIPYILILILLFISFILEQAGQFLLFWVALLMWNAISGAKTTALKLLFETICIGLLSTLAITEAIAAGFIFSHFPLSYLLRVISIVWLPINITATFGVTLKLNRMRQPLYGPLGVGFAFELLLFAIVRLL